MRAVGSRLVVLLSTLLCASSAVAASVSASVDRPECTLDDVIILTVTIEGSARREPRLPPLEAFSVAANGQSSQVQIINGSMASSVVHTYTLSPKRVGTFTIGSIAADIGGQTYQSQPLAVRVTSTEPNARSGQDGGPAFIVATVSNNEPYVGEQVVYTFRFYRRVPVLGARLQLPEFEGLSPEDLGDKVEGTEQHKGQLYNVTEINKALFASQPGTYPIAAAALSIDMQSTAPRRRNDPFDDLDSGLPFGGGFFGRARTQNRTLRSNPLELRVRPLPPSPAGFSGLVGRFAVQTSLNKHELKVGDSATLEVVVSGKGNVRGISEPTLPALADFKIYDDKPDADVHAEAGAMVGRKVFRKALVPRQAGVFTVPAVQLSYFDTAAGAYALAQSTPISVRVLPGEVNEALHAATGAADAASPKQTVEVVGDDILPIHARSSLSTLAERKLWTRAAGAGLTFPPLAFVILLLLRRRQERLERNPSLRRRRAALRRAQTELGKARASLRTHDSEAAVAAVERALKVYVGDKLDLAGGALTAVEVGLRLRQAALPDELVERVRDTIETLEATRYGHKVANESETAIQLDAIDNLLRELDRTL